MKFDCGPTWEEWKAAREQWHEKYLWFPTRLGSHDCRWLEVVERQGTLNHGDFLPWWSWKYRSLK